MIEKFRQINDNWFLSEPLLFAVLCTHKLVKNTKMSVQIRVGKMQIEYNSEKLKACTLEEVMDILKIEIIRIILKHPYQRHPYNPIKKVLAISSDITISANYTDNVRLLSPQDFGLSKEWCFEEYYQFFAKKFSGENYFSQNIPDNLEEIVALWQEDYLMENNINELIQQAQISNSWGSLSGNLVEVIEASLIVKMDYRKILNSFRASMVSYQRKLTRMRPSRRYGFQFMGSKSNFTTKLLVAIDVSGSVTDKDLQNFFSVVNRFFKYGMKQVDIIQFDTKIKGKLQSLKKAKKSIKIQGRGGTDFQPVFDYVYENPIYDGLLIFTDGFASAPNLRRRLKTKILWVLDNEQNYNNHKSWIEGLTKSKAVWIP